jgi:hypothetical protein
MEPQKLPDFSDLPAGATDEVLRLGEATLAGTVQLAVAADQRATAMAGIFGAGFVALLAVAAAVATNERYMASLLSAALTTAAGLFMAAVFSAWAARPNDFFVGGYEPRKIMKSAGNVVWMKRYACEDVQKRIDANRSSLENGAKFVRAGAVIALLSPVLGTIVFWLNRPS